MKHTLLMTALLASAAVFSYSAMAAPQTYTFDPAHTTVIWGANHFGFSNPHGMFSMVEGELMFDDAAPEKSTVNATIKMSNLVTGNPKFNEHLSSKDFFNVVDFPAATFKSTKVEKTGDKTGKLYGDLTLMGISKPVVLDVTFNKHAPNPMSKIDTVGFSASGVIKRSDWGLNYAVPNVSDEVNLTIEAEANKK